MRIILSLLFILTFIGIAFASPTVDGVLPKQIDFVGKLVNYGSPVFLQDNNFRILENFRYFDGGIGTRAGMMVYTTNNEPSGHEIHNVIYFPQENEEYLLAVSRSTSGTTYWQIESGAFTGTSLYTTTGVSTTAPITWGVVRDTLVVADGGQVWVWSGNSVFPTALLVEYQNGVYTNKFDWVHNGTQNTVTSGNTVHIGYSRPFTAFMTDSGETEWYTGLPSAVTEYYKGGQMRYWSSFTMTGNSTFQNPKIKTEPRAIGKHWDGMDWQYAFSAVFQKTGASEYQDYSLFVADSSTETYMDISEMQSGATIAFGFIYKPRMVRIEFPETNKNEAIVTSGVSYWNGSGWQAVSNYIDGTAHGGACFAQTGNLEFDPATDWQERQYGENQNSLYWMVINVNGTIDNYVRMFSVKAVPEIDSPSDSHYKGCVTWNNRVGLFNGDKAGTWIISAFNQPDVFVGSDAISEEDFFIVGKREKTIAAVPLDDGLLVMNKTENYFISGNNPINFVINPLLNTPPCVAPQSVAVYEGEETVSTGRIRRHFVIYQTLDGVYAITKEGLITKLSDDIQAYWTNGDVKAIPVARLDKSVGWNNKTNYEYNLLVASGSGATQFNEQLVFDIKRGKWTVFTRDNNVELNYGTYIVGNTQNIYHIGGGHSGEVWKLEQTSGDSGYTIVSDLTQKNYVLTPGSKSRLIGAGFNYELPDGSSISGSTLYMTASMASSATTYQRALTFDTSGWEFDRMKKSDVDAVDIHYMEGFTHKFRLRVPGRINLFREYIWSKPTPWEQQ